MDLHASIKKYAFRGVTAAVFLLPLITTPQLILDTHFGKWMFVLAIILITCTYAAYANIHKTWQIPASPMFTIFALMAIMHIVWSPVGDTSRGLWGDALRLTGAWVWAIMALFGWWLATEVRTDAKRAWMCSIITLAGVIAGIVGIATQFAPDIFGVSVNSEGISGRIIGLFGSPLYLSAFIMASLYFALALLAQVKTRFMKVLIVLGMILLLYFMIAARTRGALIGLGLSIPVMAIAYLALRAKQIKMLKGAALTVCMLAIVWVYSQAFLPQEKKVASPLHPAYMIERFAGEGGIVTRFIFWDMALKGIAEKPLIGWGTNMYEVVFDRYYNPDLYNFGAGETWGERAHNHLLENTVNFGLIGIVLYLALAIAPIWSLSETDDTKTLVTKLAMAGLTTAYVGFNMFAFDTPSLLLHLATAAALLAGLAPMKTCMPSRRIIWLKAPLAFTSGIVLVTLVAIPLRQAYAAQRALEAAQNDFPAQYDRYLKEALNGDSFIKQDILKLLTDQLVNASGFVPPPLMQSAVANILPELKRMNEKNERYAMMVREAQIRAMQAKLTKDEMDIAAAQLSFDRALTISPNRQTAWLSLIDMYLTVNQPEKAKEYARKLVETNPEYGQAHWIAGLTLVANNEYADAGKSLSKAIHLRYVPNRTTPELVELVLRALEEAGDYEAVAIFLNRHFYNANTSEFNAGLNHFRLAVAFANTGKFANARSEVAVALQLDPTLEPQVKELIRRLDGIEKLLNE